MKIINHRLVISDAKMAIAQVMNILKKSGSSTPVGSTNGDGTPVLRADYKSQDERDSAFKALRTKIKAPQKITRQGSKSIKVMGPMV